MKKTKTARQRGPTIYVVQFWCADKRWMNSIDAGMPFYKRFAAEDRMRELASNGSMKYRIAEYVPK